MSREGESRNRQRSSNIRTRLDVELPKINKTIFINREKQSSVLTTNYSERAHWVIDPVDYSQKSQQQIENEYKKLKRQLFYINEQAVKAVQKAQLKSIKKIKSPEFDSMKVLEIRDKEAENNRAIMERLQKQYQQLQKRIAAISNSSKDNLQEQISETKEKIIKMKAKIKQLKLINKTVGDSIINSDQIFEDIRRFQSERDMQERKKYKLEVKNEKVYESISASQIKLNEIFDNYEIAENFFQEYMGQSQLQTESKQLQEKYRHVNHCLEVTRKKNQIQTNTKQQKYHISLKNLQNLIEKVDKANSKANQTEISIIESKKLIEQLEAMVKDQQTTQSSKLIEEPMFFTEFQLKSQKQMEKNISEQIIVSEEKIEEKKIIEKIDTTNVIDIEEEKDQIMDLDEKFKYKTRQNIRSRVNEIETEMGEVEESQDNMNESELMDFNTKVSQNRNRLSQKKEFNIDLSSVEENIKKMDSLHLNKHEVVKKSKENMVD